MPTTRRREGTEEAAKKPTSTKASPSKPSPSKPVAGAAAGATHTKLVVRKPVVTKPAPAAAAGTTATTTTTSAAAVTGSPTATGARPVKTSAVRPRPASAAAGATAKPKSGAAAAASLTLPLRSPDSVALIVDNDPVVTPTSTSLQGAPKFVKYALRTTAQQRQIYEAIKSTAPIPELQEPKTIGTYTEAPLEESLYKIVDENDIIMVAGAFFGDEGKGKTVDAVSHHPKCTCIARVNSGENAGHTVYDKQGCKFVFNLAPSGLLVKGKRNYVGPECVMDPVSFMEKEIKQLIDANIDYHESLFVGNVCIVTPYHKLMDLIGSEANASTLKGMAPIHSSKVGKRGIRLDHIFNDEATLRARLHKDMDTYLGLLKVKGLTDEQVAARCREENSDGVMRLPDYVIDFAVATDKVQFLVDLYKTRVRDNALFPQRCDVIHELHRAIQRGEKVLLEGPQSYWLSNAREKFWGSTTSADTSAAGLLATSQLNFQRYRSVVINVHKTPASSRVGLGACPAGFVPQDYFSSQNMKTLLDLPKDMCTDFDAIQKAYYTQAFHNVDDPASFNGLAEPIEYTDASGTYNIGVAMAVASAIHHGECGAVTRKPRVCGLFDCVLHYEVNAAQGPYLTISALDRGDDYDSVGVTIGYVYYSPNNTEIDTNGHVYKNGDIIKAGDPVPSEAAMYHCYPITKLVKGWKESPISAKTRAPNTPFPAGLCEMLATIEHFTGAKILSIGNGPNGADIIYLKQ